MKLYLLRHGDALDDLADPARPLSDRGRAEITAIANFAAARLEAAAAIYHSGKLRAQQSAEIMREIAFPRATLEPMAGLSPNDDVSVCLEHLEHESRDTLLVGHLPHLGLLATQLMSGREHHHGVALETGGLVELGRHGGNWFLQSFVHPALVR